MNIIRSMWMELINIYLYRLSQSMPAMAMSRFLTLLLVIHLTFEPTHAFTLQSSQQDQFKIVFYQDTKFNCYSDHILTCMPQDMARNQHSCFSFKTDSVFRKTVASIDTFNNCVRIYTDEKCTENEFEISPNSACDGRDLSLCPLKENISWRNQIVSFRSCVGNFTAEEQQDISIEEITITKYVKNPCNNSIEIVQSESGDYYANCKEPGSQLITNFCMNQDECQNWKNQELLNHCPLAKKYETHDPSKKWRRLTSPGNITCETPTSSSSLNYFFTKTGIVDSEREIHFSWKEVELEDFIVINFPNRLYYTGETLQYECIISAYAFGSFPRFEMTYSNGSQLFEINRFKIKHMYGEWVFIIQNETKMSEPSLYSVTCGASVFYSSTLRKKLTRKVNVTTGKPPYFTQPHEFISLEPEDKQIKLTCDAEGEPRPNITWKTDMGNAFHINNTYYVSTVDVKVDRIYICEAKNSLGKVAQKNFHVQVKKIHDQKSGLEMYILMVIMLILVSLVLVVGFCMMRIKNSGKLTKEEEIEFRLGKPKVSRTNYEYILSECISYNDKLEILFQDLVFDEPKVILGEGEFGLVLKGILRGGIPVAVKTPKINCIKPLLSELKILAYIGQHENIVSLIGAVTNNIKNGELFVCVELCGSSLLKHLREINKNVIPRNGYQPHDGEIFSIEPLIEWAINIGEGMQFLASQKVIHGDLATRNVLLSLDSKMAKICDFGLSRHVPNYIYYKNKETNDLLPFRWMALETLDTLQFSTMSDVWSYGITLWEIFTLGKVPFEQYRDFRSLSDALLEGIRPLKPFYASYALYNLMKSCWLEDRKGRPTFQEILIKLKNLDSDSIQDIEPQSTGAAAYVVMIM